MPENSELLGILKDIRDYFALQDTTQERAKAEKTPKIGDTQKKLSGGEAPAGFKPADGITKQLIEDAEEDVSEDDVPVAAYENEEVAPTAEDSGETVEMNENMEENAELPEDDEPEEDLEMKSLLKDIKSLLIKNSTLEKSMTALRKEMDQKIEKGIMKGMRGVGFSPTRQPITRLGVDEPLTKSADLKDVSTDDVEKVVRELSQKSFRELAAIREATGDLTPFPYFKPGTGLG